MFYSFAVLCLGHFNPFLHHVDHGIKDDERIDESAIYVVAATRFQFGRVSARFGRRYGGRRRKGQHRLGRSL